MRNGLRGATASAFGWPVARVAEPSGDAPSAGRMRRARPRVSGALVEAGLRVARALIGVGSRSKYGVVGKRPRLRFASALVAAESPSRYGVAGKLAGLRVAGALVAAGLLSVAVQAQEGASPSGLGRPPTAAERADRIVGPDGADLPEGSGNAAEGAMVFARRGCSNCHGPTGEEGPSIALVGGDVTTRTNYWPIRHWPFAPGIWDYIRRVMPYDRPGILTDDEAYAVTAYLLYRNDIISEEAVMDAETLPRVRMPRRDDYVMPGTWTPETRRGFRIEPDR